MNYTPAASRASRMVARVRGYITSPRSNLVTVLVDTFASAASSLTPSPKPPLAIRHCRAAELEATTHAGIYAKALIVRCSSTGASALAMSLATDLVECKGLRDVLWPAGEVPA
jgi:hypothetical protein